MEKNKTEIIAQIVTLLSQLVESEDEKKNESAAVSAAAPVEMLTIKECAEAVTVLTHYGVSHCIDIILVKFAAAIGTYYAHFFLLHKHNYPTGTSWCPWDLISVFFC